MLFAINPCKAQIVLFYFILFNVILQEYGRVALFWGVVVGVNVVATILEILCLYVDSLSAAASIASLLGLDPWLMGYPLAFLLPILFPLLPFPPPPLSQPQVPTAGP
jgi:hypothetical protein